MVRPISEQANSRPVTPFLLISPSLAQEVEGIFRKAGSESRLAALQAQCAHSGELPSSYAASLTHV